MFKSGQFVAQHVEPLDGGELSDEQVQPNGVDLTVDKVETTVETDYGYKVSVLDSDGKTLTDRVELSTTQRDFGLTEVHDWDGTGVNTYPIKTILEKEAHRIDPDKEYFVLPPGNHIIKYGEKLTIPEGHTGYVYPRSSVMRMGHQLDTAVWDAGYTGRGEGLIQVNGYFVVEKGERICQIVYAESEHEEMYDGQYQGQI